MLFSKKSEIPSAADALPGRDTPIAVPERHTVLGTPLVPPFPEGVETVQVGLGCFWGAERIFWRLPGVYTTAVGYAGGSTPNPTLPRGLLRPHRPHRDRARRVRPEAGLVRADPEGLLGGPRPDPGHAPGQRLGHPVPLGDLHHHRRAAGRRARLARHVQRGARRRTTAARSPPRSTRPATSTTPRTTTSSTSTRTPAATAASAAPASPARSAPASTPPDRAHARSR